MAKDYLLYLECLIPSETISRFPSIPDYNASTGMNMSGQIIRTENLVSEICSYTGRIFTDNCDLLFSKEQKMCSINI